MSKVFICWSFGKLDSKATFIIFIISVYIVITGCEFNYLGAFIAVVERWQSEGESVIQPDGICNIAAPVWCIKP